METQFGFVEIDQESIALSSSWGTNMSDTESVYDSDWEGLEQYLPYGNLYDTDEEETLIYYNYVYGRLHSKAKAKARRCWQSDEYPKVTCDNHFVMTGKRISSDTEMQSVELPAALAPLLFDMHRPNPERTREIIDMLFTGPAKKYIRGDFFTKEPDRWTVFRHATKVNHLRTKMVRSFIRAALNSRRRLCFVIGVADDGKITGCKLSNKRCTIIRRQLEKCIYEECISPIHGHLVRYFFHQVYDEEGNIIPSLYLIEISVNGIVDTFYILPNGCICYVNCSSDVKETSSNDPSNMFIERYAGLDRVFKNQDDETRNTPCLREPCTSGSSLLKRALLFGISGFVIGFFAYDFLPKISF